MRLIPEVYPLHVPSPPPFPLPFPLPPFPPSSPDFSHLDPNHINQYLGPQYQSKEDGWYEGVLKGRRGLFPGNYVQISGSEDPYMHTTVTTLTLCILTINLSESKGKAMMLLPTQ